MHISFMLSLCFRLLAEIQPTFGNVTTCQPYCRLTYSKHNYSVMLKHIIVIIRDVSTEEEKGFFYIKQTEILSFSSSF